MVFPVASHGGTNLIPGSLAFYGTHLHLAASVCEIHAQQCHSSFFQPQLLMLPALKHGGRLRHRAHECPH